MWTCRKYITYFSFYKCSQLRYFGLSKTVVSFSSWPIFHDVSVRLWVKVVFLHVKFTKDQAVTIPFNCQFDTM